MRLTCEHSRPLHMRVFFKGDTPIFCTAKGELSCVFAGVMDERDWNDARSFSIVCFPEPVYPQS